MPIKELAAITGIIVSGIAYVVVVKSMEVWKNYKSEISFLIGFTASILIGIVVLSS